MGMTRKVGMSGRVSGYEEATKDGVIVGNLPLPNEVQDLPSLCYSFGCCHRHPFFRDLSVCVYLLPAECSGVS